MEKFGSDSLRGFGVSGLELEIAQEQAEALGLAGRKLQDSIDAYNRTCVSRPEGPIQPKLLKEIASRAWALIVQRELLGFRHENLRYIRERFDIPRDVWRFLTESDPAQASGSGR